MSEIDQIIFDMFNERWVEKNPFITKDINSMKKQLHKNLSNQIDGYWSGHTAYHLMVDGGFLIDSKPGTDKRLTALGELFMRDYKT
jgi:hypothetical protein